MLIGLISDSHDNITAIGRAVALFNERRVDLVLHAGDYVSPFSSRGLCELTARMVGVFGNNDGDRIGLKERFGAFCHLGVGPLDVEHEGRRFLVMHEPAALHALAQTDTYDAVVFGHTHKVEVRRGTTLVVNPGECGGWVTGRCTVALLDVDRGEVEVVEL